MSHPTTKRGLSLSGPQIAGLTLLRLFVGWHFLYEGIVKILTPGWTSASYLENSQWLLGGLMRWIAATPSALRVVDLLNMWGLTLIGLALILGAMTRLACVAGVALLALYYVTNPPFLPSIFGAAMEGSYLGIDKNLVEMAGLLVLLLFPAGQYFGLDRLWTLWRQGRTTRGATVPPAASAPAAAAGATAPLPYAPTGVATEAAGLNRKEALKGLATVPVLGVFAGAVLHHHSREGMDGLTGATIQVSQTRLQDLKGELPKGTIGGHAISRLIMGGNLIGGWAHSRDLLYVPSLFKAYNTEAKVYETLQLGERAGINAINISLPQFPIVNAYKRRFGSQLKTICQVHPTADDVFGPVDQAIDAGVDLIQIQGNCCDWRVREGRIDVLAQCIDYIRRQGFPAGLGAHSVEALMECDKAGITPDFYMKTLHHDRYWSAHPRENRVPYSVDGARSPNHGEFHDNMFCLFPERTVAFMEDKDIPFIGFKVLAGGAIEPRDGFSFAYQNGADFICVGMFDYQIVDDVNITLDVLPEAQGRKRPWRA